MIPLALTSTQWSIRKLGKKWQKLHRLIYFSAIAGVVHFLWAVKLDKRKPEIYASILGVLLVYRLLVWYWGRAAAPKGGLGRSQPQPQRVVADEPWKTPSRIA
jgi:sulfoxide reductase heme-binding subunit YedZ